MPRIFYNTRWVHVYILSTRLVILRRYSMATLRHPKMADAFLCKQLRGRISPSVRNKHSLFWTTSFNNTRIWQKRSILCEREGNESRRDAGFSTSRFCHDAGSSIPGCRYLIGDTPSSSLDFMLTVTYPTYFIHSYIHGLCWRIETFMSSDFFK